LKQKGELIKFLCQKAKATRQSLSTTKYMTKYVCAKILYLEFTEWTELTFVKL